MRDTILQAVKHCEAEMIAFRQELHINPELSFNEEKTTSYIVEKLESFGYNDIKVGFSSINTGVCADLNSQIKGPIIALRADIDALPIEEESDSFFQSLNKGISHACGHDAHTAILLATAKVLYELRNKINAHIRIIFQPAEECSISVGESKTGAYFVRESGALNGVGAIFGLHVWGDYPAGKICCNTGYATAAVASFGLDINGKGGHGGMPHNAVDPVTSLCNIVELWQQIISREKNPFVPAVLTVGKIEAGTRYNIIPQSANLCGTCRALSNEVMEFLKNRMEECAKHTALATRCDTKFTFDVLHGCVNNNPECVECVKESVTELFGEDDFLFSLPVMGGEDFSNYTDIVPGALFFLGMKDKKKGICYGQHHPKFRVNDEVLYKGVATFISCVMKTAEKN